MAVSKKFAAAHAKATNNAYSARCFPDVHTPGDVTDNSKYAFDVTTSNKNCDSIVYNSETTGLSIVYEQISGPAIKVSVFADRKEVLDAFLDCDAKAMLHASKFFPPLDGRRVFA